MFPPGHNDCEMTSIPLHRVAILRPFAHYLADLGTPVERGFQRAGLPCSALDNLHGFVPSQRFWTFVGDMARNEGIEDLGFRVGKTYGADCADPNFTRLLRRSPTLYDGLMQASAFVGGATSHNHIGLVLPPLGGQAHFFHQPSFGPRNSNYDQINWFGLTAAIGMVRVYLGPEWQPGEIGLSTHQVPCRAIREQLPDTRILTSQAYSYIAIENELLSRPPLIRENATPVASRDSFDPVSTDFACSLRQVLQTYIREKDLSIEFAADLCNISKRSLQRRLTETGTRYSEVLDQARFNAASELLQDPDIKITDVAHELGYSDSAHFTRAFRRTAGIAPRTYRKQCQH
jgi:AraC-like DNA-binding protein